MKRESKGDSRDFGVNFKADSADLCVDSADLRESSDKKANLNADSTNANLAIKSDSANPHKSYIFPADFYRKYL